MGCVAPENAHDKKSKKPDANPAANSPLPADKKKSSLPEVSKEKLESAIPENKSHEVTAEDTSKSIVLNYKIGEIISEGTVLSIVNYR